MSGLAYIDSSALLKLAVAEPETDALEADLAWREGVVASPLIAVECRRAARRGAGARALVRVEEALESVSLVPLTDAILDRAGAIGPPPLRTLDAIHLATALSLGDPDLDVITYDERFAAAARVNGLRVVQPGR